MIGEEERDGDDDRSHHPRERVRDGIGCAKAAQ
jgi:hypothetical protein